jgi:anthranilate phosphoribosyltransferase
VLAARQRAEGQGMALVFRGEDGLDELSTVAPSRVWLVSGGAVLQEQLEPLDLGVPRATLADLRGGDAAHNAQVVRDVLAGQGGPIRDAVLLNAAGALVASGVGEGELTDRLAAGLRVAEQSVDSGAAADVLRKWVAASAG